MTLYVMVDMTENPDNLFRIDNMFQATTKPPQINGYRWLTEGDFAPGAQANIGLYWTGGLPAQFIEKPDPIIPADAPTTQTDALDQAEAKLREGLDLIATARALG